MTCLKQKNPDLISEIFAFKKCAMVQEKRLEGKSNTIWDQILIQVNMEKVKQKAFHFQMNAILHLYSTL